VWVTRRDWQLNLLFENKQFYCFCSFSFTSTPSAFRFASQLTRYINYLLILAYLFVYTVFDLTAGEAREAVV